MLHGARIASDESAFDFARPSQTAIGEPGGGGLITVPDAHLLFNGDFQRHGSDLKIVGEEGKSFLVPDYFKGEKNPTLLSPEGAALTGDIVEALAGPRAPGQYAQAGQQQTSDQPAIGRVEQVSGNATIVRNGVAIAANQGDVVRKGDVVQTGDGQIAVLFSDGSTFSLSAGARMVLNDFVYQAGGANNSALISLVQGTIGFVAGQVAKTGDMRVETPVATMGIRGTAVLIEITANNGQTKFSVLVEPDGTTGSFNLYDKSSGALLGTVNNSTVGWVVTPAGPLQVIAQQVQKSPGEVQQELIYFQNIFNLFNNGQNNPFVPEQRTDNPNPQNTNGQGTQITTNLPGNQSNTPSNGLPSGPITVVVTPVNTGNNDPTNNTNNTPNDPLPDQQTVTFNVIYGTQFNDNDGTGFNDQPHLIGTEIDDFVYAGAGDDVIIAGHGGGDDYYDGDRSGPGPGGEGGPGFDTIAFPSADASQPLEFHLHGITAQNTVDGPVTDDDIFTNIERIESGAGHDKFYLYDRSEWEIDGGAGVDTLILTGNLSFRDYQPGGPEITNFEIIDLNDGVGDAFANEVDFDYHGSNEMFAGNSLRVIGGSNDKINLIDASPEHPDGHWVLLQTFEPVFGDSLTSTVTFNAWAYYSGGETPLFTIYVDADVQVNVIESVDVVVHTPDGYDLSDGYDDLANLGELDIDVEAETASGEANGKRIVFSLENIGGDAEFPELANARVKTITVYGLDYYGEPTELLLTLDGFDIPLLQLDAALAAYVASEYEDTALLDAIFGNATYNVTGNEGNDILTGGNYRDVIDGGDGDDTMTGGLNADTFVYNGGEDTITDFSIAGDDRIDLSAFGAIHSMADLGPRAHQDGANTVVDFGNGNMLTLENVVLNNLSDNDFIFNPKAVVEAGADDQGISTSTTSLIMSTAEGKPLTLVPANAVEFDGHYYKFISASNLSWTDARAQALAMGGYLASITSAAENSFIRNSVTGGNYAWIGASDTGSEGAWTWADGPEAGQQFWQGAGLPQGGSVVNNAYNAWWGSEPNDAGGNEDYALIDHNGAWTDVPATYGVAGYVVEFSFTQTGTYGTLFVNPATGQLTYVLDNDDSDTQALIASESAVDSFDITLRDANNNPVIQHVDFTVIGANDAPEITFAAATYLNFGGDNVASTSDVLAQSTDVTMEVWANWDGEGPDSQVLFYNGHSSTSGFGLFLARDDGGMQIKVLIGGQTFLDSDDYLTADEWAHVALVRGADDFKLYVNGELAHTWSFGGIVTPNGAISLGGNVHNGDEAFSGAISEARLWDEARSAEDIAEFMSTSLTDDGHLVGYWPLNEGQGTNASDLSDHGRDLDFGDQATWLTDSTGGWPQTGVSLNEDQATIIRGISIADPDANAGTSEIEVSLSVTHGMLSFSVLPLDITIEPFDGGVTFKGSLADINALLHAGIGYTPDQDFVGSDTLQMLVSEQGDNSLPSGYQTIAVTVSAKNTPVIQTDDVEAVSLGDTDSDGTMVTGLSITDVDADNDPLDVTLSAEDGTLTITVDGDDQSGSNLSFEGSLDDINDVLGDGVIYTPGQDTTTDKVTMTVDDGHGGSDTVNFIFAVDPEGGVTLSGTPEKDMIFGTGGSDILSGGESSDEGNDTFVFDLGEPGGTGNDVITDFNPLADKIQLNSGAYSQFSDLDIEMNETETDTVVSLGDGNTITLLNVTSESLSAANFVFHPDLQ
jgi:VCBS repeat-containing protein